MVVDSDAVGCVELGWRHTNPIVESELRLVPERFGDYQALIAQIGEATLQMQKRPDRYRSRYLLHHVDEARTVAGFSDEL